VPWIEHSVHVTANARTPNFEGLPEADELRGNGVGRALALLYAIYALRYAADLL
jgi:hypothetical protein